MATKYDLEKWLIEALKVHKGSAPIVDVCRYVWDTYESELKRSGDLFFTWQYDIRWAATRLRGRKVLQAAGVSPWGRWELAKKRSSN